MGGLHMTVLNQCPDCGSHEVFLQVSKKVEEKYSIKCKCCALESKDFDSPEEAISIWNILPPAVASPIIFECADYAAHRDPADLYPSIRVSLIDLLSLGDPFIATSLEAKCDSARWRMTRRTVNGPITIRLQREIEADYGLVYDASPEGTEMSPSQMDEILNRWILSRSRSSDITVSSELSGQSSLDNILDEVPV